MRARMAERHSVSARAITLPRNVSSRLRLCMPRVNESLSSGDILRLGEIIPLRPLAIHRLEHHHLVRRLDALGNEAHSQVPRQVNNRVHDGSVIRPLVHAMNETLINFETVQRETVQITER